MKYTLAIFVNNVTGTNYIHLQAFIIDKHYSKLCQIETSHQVSVTGRISSSGHRVAIGSFVVNVWCSLYRNF